ncbi:MAG: chloride channel protein, partial [Pseudomonadota bacterium]
MALIGGLIQKTLTRFRHRLADIDALPQLTIVGIVIGCAAGLLIVAFRYGIELFLDHLLPEHNENFEGLSHWWHFGLPIAGALIIGSGLHLLKARDRHVSVGHVLERLHNFQGRMPAINLAVQFVGGMLSLVTGQSVGREGPAIHIGASTGSLIGQWLKLPNNSLSTLIGCGVAAAISASFNTPVAGVIFAMEVVLMRYSITGFIPIMMASVCGALITRATFGSETFFTVADAELHGLLEIPFMIVAGIAIALFATLYMRLQLGFNRFSHYPIFWRVMAAGLVTGMIGLMFPQILGLGYDTITMTLEGKFSLSLLLAIGLAKLLATSFSISMGIPGGLIGPQLFIGACLGGIIGIIGHGIFPESISNNGIYVLLGMAAMMGAVLNAPLAALMAVLELTYNPSIIFPSMLIIVVACVITRQLYKCDGIFVEQLNLSGTQLDVGPIQSLLGNIGVRSAMKTSLVISLPKLTQVAAKNLISGNPLWLIVDTESEYLLMRAADLALALKTIEDAEQASNTQSRPSLLGEEASIDLLEIPAQRYTLLPIAELSSLFEAKKSLDKQPGNALFVTPQIQTETRPKILGIITQDTI